MRTRMCLALLLVALVALVVQVPSVRALRRIKCYCYRDGSVCPSGKTVVTCSGSCMIVLNSSSHRALQMGCTTVVKADSHVDRAGGNVYRYCNRPLCNDAVFYGASLSKSQ